MSKLYNKLPSELLHIKDEYTAYCFDEACAYILTKMESGEQPSFRKSYTNFADLYKNMNVSNKPK